MRPQRRLERVRPCAALRNLVAYVRLITSPHHRASITSHLERVIDESWCAVCVKKTHGGGLHMRFVWLCIANASIIIIINTIIITQQRIVVAHHSRYTLTSASEMEEHTTVGKSIRK